MGYQTNFQQKNNYLAIEKQLLNILNQEKTHKTQNYENFINPSLNLKINNYNGLLNIIGRNYSKKL
jgi:hypothetical protein